MTAHTVPTGTAAPQLRKNSLGAITLAVFVISAVGPVAALLGASPFIFMSVGPGASVAYIIATALFLLIAVGYVAMAKRLPNAGGFISFIAAAFDRRIGASAAMLAITAYTALLASIYAVFGVFLTDLLSSLLGWNAPWWASVAIGLIVVTVASMNRVDVNAKTISVILLIEVALILVLVIAIVAQGGNAGLTFEPLSPTPLFGGGLAVGLLWAMGSFLGFEATTVFSEEAREPKKTVPRATYLAVGLMGGFFILVTWAISVGYGTGNVQAAALEDPVGFIYALGDTYVGGIWSPAMSVMVVVSFALILIGFHNIVCRYVFALGRAGFLPAVLGKTHPRTQAPHMAGLAVGAVCVVILGAFSVFGADPYGQIYPWLYALGAVGMYFILFSVCVSTVVYFRKHDRKGNPFSGLVAPLISGCGVLAVLTIIFLNYDQLVGADAPVLVVWSPVLLPLVAVVGFLIGRTRSEQQLSFAVANFE